MVAKNEILSKYFRTFCSTTISLKSGTREGLEKSPFITNWDSPLPRERCSISSVLKSEFLHKLCLRCESQLVTFQFSAGIVTYTVNCRTTNTTITSMTMITRRIMTGSLSKLWEVSIFVYICIFSPLTTDLTNQEAAQRQVRADYLLFSLQLRSEQFKTLTK